MGDQTEQSQTRIEEEVGRVLEQAKELQEVASSLISRSSKEEKDLQQRAQSLNASIAKLRSSISSPSFDGHVDAGLHEKLEDELNRAKCILVDGDTSPFHPRKDGSFFLKLFLCPINVRAMRKDVQLKVKEEYNSFNFCLEFATYGSFRFTPVATLALSLLLPGSQKITGNAIIINEISNYMQALQL